jgi:hypothetical protein
MRFNPDTLPEGWSELSSRDDILECHFNIPLEEFPELQKEPGKFTLPEETGHFHDIGKPEVEKVWETDEDGNRELKFTIYHSHDYKLYVLMYLITTKEVIPTLTPGVTVLYFPEVSGTENDLLITPVVTFENMGKMVNGLVEEGKITGFAGIESPIYFRDLYSHFPVFQYEPEGGGSIHPYEKIYHPGDPVNVEDLPVGFPIPMEELNARFDEQKRIQLVEIGYDPKDLYTYGVYGWVSLDGQKYDDDGNPIEE